MAGRGLLWWCLITKSENLGSRGPQGGHGLCRSLSSFQTKSSFLAWGRDKRAATVLTVGIGLESTTELPSCTGQGGGPRDGTRL